MKPRNISILGSTGSIGKSTLDVIARHPERFSVYALSGYLQVDEMFRQCQKFRPKIAVMADEAAARALRENVQAAALDTEVLCGTKALCEIASDRAVDVVVAAIAGAVGLKPTWAAVKAGKVIALANKESLVMAGALFMQVARDAGATILPVDSEHNAIYQVLPAQNRRFGDGIQSLILTASGGPFLLRDTASLSRVTPNEAVAHPNWAMGRKISVDSASMMNKGLELIEAHWLFDCPAERLEVVIHPQSIIHSMVRYSDGSVIAQMGVPDMRTPIAYCLGYPERIDAGSQHLDFTALSGLTFLQPEKERFPCLFLAYEAMKAGGSAPCVLNAANEVAAAQFLAGQLKFTDIAAVVEAVLSSHSGACAGGLEELCAIDEAARKAALVWAAKFGS